MTQRVDDPAVKTDIRALSAKIEASEIKTRAADQSLRSSVRVQEGVLHEIQKVQPQRPMVKGERAAPPRE